MKRPKRLALALPVVPAKFPAKSLGEGLQSGTHLITNYWFNMRLKPFGLEMLGPKSTSRSKKRKVCREYIDATDGQAVGRKEGRKKGGKGQQQPGIIDPPPSMIQYPNLIFDPATPATLPEACGSLQSGPGVMGG